MKSKKFWTILIISSLSIFALTSCDIGKAIVVKNKSQSPAYFRLNFSTDSIIDETNSVKAIKSGTINLGTSEKDKKAMIIFGFGGWPTTEVKTFVNKIESIEMEGANTKLKITDKAEIEKFLISRRHGIFFKNVIVIDIR